MVLDKKVLSGIICGIILVVAVSGVMSYNLQDHSTNGINTNTIAIDDQNIPITEAAHFQSTDNLQNSITTPSENSQANPTSTSSSDRWPRTEPTSKQMHHIISLFDAYLESNYDQNLIPGMAVVIVKDGKTIYMNTLGVKDLASGEPVDKNTLFGIGSNTKPFTATNVGQLVSKGLMSWDDPLSKYFRVPDEFQLYSDYVTNNITIRDALTHRSGLPALDGDLIWAGFNQPYPYIMKNLRYRENSTPVRSTWQYNNLIYVIPGYAAARVNNTTWSELIKEDLLIPLGMTTSVTSYWDFLNTSNQS